jgi:alkanesulfonate monooxygenase SsuD/methylene tetrahydromethanopterin reductase-like flavin-dependent oxidoreductase (luciferase family)
VDLVIRLRERGFQHRLHGAADQRGLGSRMFEHVREIIGGEQRVDRDRNDSRQQGAQEGDRPVGAILHQDEDAFLALDASLLERRGETSDPLVKLAVGHRADIVDERRLVGTPRIGVKQMRREVERLGRRFNGAPGHQRLPRPGRHRRLAQSGLMQYYAY